MNQATPEQDELSLPDILKVLQNHRKSILWVPVIFGLVALIFCVLFIKPSYRASAIIQVGQVGQVGPKLLEGGLYLEARLKDKSFVSRLKDVNPALFSQEGDLIQKSLDVKKQKDAELVDLRILGSSPEMAKQNAQAVFALLEATHRITFDQHLTKIHEQINMTDIQIDLLKKQSSSLQRSIDVSRGLNSYNAVVDAIRGGDQDALLRNLTARRLELESSLNGAETYNTKLLGGIHVSDAPESPKLVLIALVAALLGLFGAIFLAFVRESLKNKAL